MNPRTTLIGTLIVISAASFAGVLVQGRHLKEAHAAALPITADSAPAPIEVSSPGPTSESPAAAAPDTAELLRLRNQVSQLNERKRELSAVREEHDRLRKQLATRGTNTPGTLTLPQGYIRKSQAQWVGMNTPEDAIQSFLWAAKSGDITNLAQVLVPEMSLELLRVPPERQREIVAKMAELPGLRIVSQDIQPDGTLVMGVDFSIQDPPQIRPLRLRQIDGQWKLNLH